MGLKRILRNLDWWLIFAVLILMGCGLGLIDSATHSFAVSTGKSWHFNRQSTFMLIAIFLAICTLRFDYRILKNYATPFYIFNVLILIAVMFFGTTQLGAQRWIQIGGFTVQPSEFAKVFLIICLAAFMERRIEWLEDFKDYIPVFLYIFVPFVLVLKQP
ncbi:MAG: FtsW/RodA/SpoVE family cell cycle protein, partial [Phascolarctobacterium sp.]|nr:FtsW/RodA/SpoVE family cell cycle protein [Phascolarctobacterium sp.]